MTTSYIQGAKIDPDLKAVLEALRTEVLVTGSGVDATARAAATAAQADLDATEATVITDLGVLRTAIIAALTALDTLATKLNADAGVTDTNYATNNVATNSPAAVTTA